MTISVIIPTYNEAARIEATLASITSQTGPWEIIVVDGESADNTCALARASAIVLTAPRGRARQMNRGWKASQGDVLLFVHADTRLPPRAMDVIRRTLEDPEAEAGAFTLRFDVEAPLLRMFSFFTRFKWPSICFGDRGLFVRRAAFKAIGGFPDIPIFEDLRAVRLLYRRGGFCFLSLAVTTAARRFVSKGSLRQQLLNIYLWTRYQMGANPENLSRLYPVHRKLK